MASYTNIHGRRGGRGIRPWLLLPKVLGAAAYFGGLLAAAAVIIAAQPDTAEQWRELTFALRAIFVYVAVPGLIVAMLCGLVLLWQHHWVLWRMRWMKVKLALLVVSIPTLHLFMSKRLEQVREAGEGGVAMTQFNAALGVAIFVATAVIVLGRHKPRLGQSPAAHTPRSDQPTRPTHGAA